MSRLFVDPFVTLAVRAHSGLLAAVLVVAEAVVGVAWAEELGTGVAEDVEAFAVVAEEDIVDVALEEDSQGIAEVWVEEAFEAVVVAAWASELQRLVRRSVQGSLDRRGS